MRNTVVIGGRIEALSIRDNGDVAGTLRHVTAGTDRHFLPFMAPSPGEGQVAQTAELGERPLVPGAAQD